MSFFEEDKKIYLRQKKYHPNIIRANIVNKLVKKTKLKKVLDLGCGVGYLQKIISKNKNLKKITNIERSSKAIEILKKNFISKKSEIIQADLNKKWSAKIKGKYDVIVCLSVYQYLKNHNNFLKDVGVKLKKGGFFIISCPNKFFDLYALNERSYLFFDELTKVNKYKIKKIFKNIKIKNKNKNSFFNENYKSINPMLLKKMLKRNNLEFIKYYWLKIHKYPPGILDKRKQVIKASSDDDVEFYKASTFLGIFKKI